MQSPRFRSERGAPLDAHAFFAPGSPSRSIPGLAFWELNVATGQISYTPDWSILFGLEEGPKPSADLEWWWQRVPEEDKTEFRNACRECIEGRKPLFEVSIRMELPDTRIAWLQVRGMGVRDEAGRVIRVAGSVNDITGLRSDRRFLPYMDDNAETYSAMLENSPDLILRFDRDLYPFYANPATSAYFQVSPEKLASTTLAELGVAQETRAFLRRNIESVFADGLIIKETATFHSPIRGDVTAEYHFWPEFAPDRTVKAVICQMRDRTKQKQAEQEKRLNEERLDALYRLTQMQEASEQEIIQFVLEQIAQLTKSKHSYLFFPAAGDRGAGRIYWSKSMHDLIGAEALPIDLMPHQCCGREHDFYGEVTSPCIVNMEGQEGHVVFDVLCVNRYIILPAIEDGRVVCIASVCNKDKNYDESDLRQIELFINGVWLVLRRIRLMRDLRKAKEAAEEANRIKSEFLANVSHELRTPLNGMLGMLQLLQMSPLEAEQQEYVHTASLSGQALLRILSDILDYSRMESGKMDLRIAPFDLHATLLSTMSLFTGRAKDKGLATAVRIAENLPRALMGDDARIRQIVFNLVGNALKFTEQGGITVECFPLRHGAHGKVWVYLAVRDTGIGIPSHAHSHIFEAFTQLDSSNTRKYPGTGLGLGIVKRLVQMMGGTLAVDSEPGKGTTMHCVLPFEPAAVQSLPQSRQPGRSDAALDILVAEDDPVGRFALRAFLRHTKHRIVCVDNGRQALEALQLYAFDCLLTDIQMPVMDGLETARRIRVGDFAGITPTQGVMENIADVIPEAAVKPLAAIPRDLPVVALTAHAMSGDREYFLKMGMDMYLSKPLSMEDLHAGLARVAEKIAKKEFEPSLHQDPGKASQNRC